MGLRKGQKLMVNGTVETPIRKHKLWEKPGWTSKKIRALIEEKQVAAKRKFAEEARKNPEGTQDS